MLIHAKHALYHWATSPAKKSPFCFCRFSKSFNSKSTAQTCNMFPQICMKHYKLSLEMLGIEPRTSYMESMRSTTELHPHLTRVFFCFCRFKNTINPVVGNYQDISEIILLKYSWKSLNNNKCLEMLGIEPSTSYMRSMRSTTELHPLLRKVLSASVGFQNHLIQNLQQRHVICFLKFAWNTIM